MSKTPETYMLERTIRIVTAKLSVFGCFEVTIGIGGRERVDYMTLDTKGIFRCYEIKTTLSDFRSAAAVSFHGHYNYYVLTPELYELVKYEIPDGIGVYSGRRLAKRAKKQELLLSPEDLKLSFIRSLSREASKYRKSNEPGAIEHYDKRIRNLEKDLNTSNNRYRDLRTLLYRAYGRNWEEKLEALAESEE